MTSVGSSTKSVLITGATSGIGESLVKRYLAADQFVYACGRNERKLSNLVTSSAAGSQSSKHDKYIAPLVFDVKDKTAIQECASKVAALDTLILNAGDCQYIDDVMDFDAEAFESVIYTNLTSLAGILKYFLPKVKRGGTVVFVSSIATVLPFSRTEAYGASKAGVDYLANSLRVDLKSKGINVTLVHPGFIKTPLTDKNDFSMPFLMSSEQAAERIYSGVCAGKKYLHFPKKFTFLLKMIALLPSFVWHKVAIKRA